jgi:uncharacterized tellurite resistance protein B-like protein
MVSLLRFLGLGVGSSTETEPESLREIGAQLEALPEEEARFTAAFAYLLARIAGADLRTEENEQAEIARHLERFGGVDAGKAGLLAASAVQAAEAHGASDNHLVARSFREMASPEDCLRLLRCLYAVAAADETISTLEDNEIFEVARTLGVANNDVIVLRSEFREYLGALKALPGER